MRNIHIREIKFEDLINIFDLGEKIFTANDWPILYRTWDEYEIIERFLSDSEYFLIAEDRKGEIIGFIIGSVIKKHRGPWVYGYINWIAVKSEYQKKGIGKRLFNLLVKKFKKSGINMLMIDTSPENKKAIDFFGENGFSQQEEHLYMFKNLTRKKT